MPQAAFNKSDKLDGRNSDILRWIITQTYILDPIQDKLPMDQWFCVGLSTVNLDGKQGQDYINGPQRFYNDQFWLTYDPYYWHKIIAIGAIALGVIIVLTIFLIKRNKGKTPSTADGKKPTL
nr:hypothetical protein [Candidatus Sigynarchaeum springense]